ncbi:MAG: MmcQ/YjbR family DNA-binding protein [Chitinophagaceae bacterium]|nr:MAG: MmcQ/YjbR family DNA-binding protein [Chitinophagaceae bacterium]
MVSPASFHQLALSFPEAEEAAHFEKTSFRVRKKIFATHNAAANRACLKLTEADQFVFSLAAKGVIYPVPNKWGKQGWTNVDLLQVDVELFADALRKAYCAVAPAALGNLVADSD